MPSKIITGLKEADIMMPMNDNAELIPEDEKVALWTWKNCRSIGISVQFWLWPWHIGTYRSDDCYGGEMVLSLGPLCFVLHYSIGNASANSIASWGALSEIEAYQRSTKV